MADVVEFKTTKEAAKIAKKRIKPFINWSKDQMNKERWPVWLNFPCYEKNINIWNGKESIEALKINFKVEFKGANQNGKQS